MENETWIIVPLPEGRRAIKCKWVLDFKEGYEGVDPRWKARLVACGYDQLFGVDYLATYSPVVKHHSIRLVLAIAAAFDLEMVQLDIKTAFLYGALKETIYMRQSEGYVIPGREEEVCRLQRPIYGLKQSSNCWKNEFNKFLLQFGFLRSKYDPCVYYRIRADGEYTILIIYVDDGLACSNRPLILTAILDYLRQHFKVRSLPPNRFVGLNITRDRPNRTLCINQPEFTRRLLKKYGMDECYPVAIPVEKGNQVNAEMSPKTEEERRLMSRKPVREAVGSLMYLMSMTRGDIAYAVNQIAAFVSNPGPGHWEAIKRILAYLAGTIRYGIRFGGEGMNAERPLIGHTDANFADVHQARKSTSGFCFQLHGGLVAWASKRQRSVALSTTDSEFYAASEGSRDAIWLKSVLAELGIDVGAVPIFCDSKCAISVVEDPINHQRVKHIDIKYFFIRDQQELGRIKMFPIPSRLQIADILTKPLPKKTFEFLRGMMGIHDVTK